MTTKSNFVLKAGYIVEQDNGKRGLVITIADGTNFIYWFDRATHLIKTHSLALLDSKTLGIRKVFRGPTDSEPSKALSSDIYGKQELIWEYEEPMVELTLAEIAEKFNIKLDRLKIKDYE